MCPTAWGARTSPTRCPRGFGLPRPWRMRERPVAAATGRPPRAHGCRGGTRGRPRRRPDSTATVAARITWRASDGGARRTSGTSGRRWRPASGTTGPRLGIRRRSGGGGAALLRCAGRGVPPDRRDRSGESRTRAARSGGGRPGGGGVGDRRADRVRYRRKRPGHPRVGHDRPGGCPRTDRTGIAVHVDRRRHTEHDPARVHGRREATTPLNRAAPGADAVVGPEDRCGTHGSRRGRSEHPTPVPPPAGHTEHRLRPAPAAPT